MADLKRIEAAIWSMADGRDTTDDVALFEADERVSVMVLDRLLGEADEDLGGGVTVLRHGSAHRG